MDQKLTCFFVLFIRHGWKGRLELGTNSRALALLFGSEGKRKFKKEKTLSADFERKKVEPHPSPNLTESMIDRLFFSKQLDMETPSSVLATLLLPRPFYATLSSLYRVKGYLIHSILSRLNCTCQTMPCCLVCEPHKGVRE
jgi:hypothetical protein